MRDACKRLADAGIQVSLFIDADEEQIKAAAEVGAPFIEIHTGCYADAKTDAEQAQELARITKAATFAASLGLKVNAGHGLTYHNVKAIAAIPEMHETEYRSCHYWSCSDDRTERCGGRNEAFDAGSAWLMAILGLGTDIVEIARIEAVIARSGERPHVAY